MDVILALLETACMQSLFPAAVFLAVGSKRKWKHLLTYIRHIGAIGRKTKDTRASRSFRFFECQLISQGLVVLSLALSVRGR